VIGLNGKPVALFAIGTDQTIREPLDIPSGSKRASRDQDGAAQSGRYELYGIQRRDTVLSGGQGR
jgi:hypothetical protein